MLNNASTLALRIGAKAEGALNVSGDASAWTGVSDVAVGYLAAGWLNVTDGGTVRNAAGPTG
ncbi:MULTISPECIES: hypothetical protein [Stenotrophomonas]|uniref:hypothetical protein n=1 Tax=Stenotrophomonas TaxID=40323 RepID=UPI0008A4D51A|nr:MULTISPECIES: hypothetical protein [Stenotrophomonas]OFU89041.1 hypothetical protein HMPREF3114_18395 [Stenotrophomonas sp. HMSC10F07]